MTKPWRWINAGAADLGEWVLKARAILVSGRTVDLRQAPAIVEWVQLDGTGNDRRKQLKAGGAKPHTPEGTVLIIGDSMSPPRQQRLASQILGATVVEAVDLRDLVTFASARYPCLRCSSRIADFAASLMTGTSPDDLMRRHQTIAADRSRKDVSALEQAAQNFLTATSHPGAAALLASRPAGLLPCTQRMRNGRWRSVP